MLPTNSRAWIFVIVALLLGFVIGQLLKARKDRIAKNENAYRDSLRKMALADELAKTKKSKKKKRQINQKRMGK